MLTKWKTCRRVIGDLTSFRADVMREALVKLWGVKFSSQSAGLAQLIEQLICTQQVISLNLISGSKKETKAVCFSPPDSEFFIWRLGNTQFANILDRLRRPARVLPPKSLLGTSSRFPDIKRAPWQGWRKRVSPAS